MQVNMRHLALAKRLTFTPDGTSMWSGESGWRVRMLFAWQRLVRAPKVTVHRKSSDMWKEGECTRVAELAQIYKAELSRDDDWMDTRDTPRGQRYHWDSEATLQTQRAALAAVPQQYSNDDVHSTTSRKHRDWQAARSTGLTTTKGGTASARWRKGDRAPR